MLDRLPLTTGHAGAHPSCLMHADLHAKRHGIAENLIEPGGRKLVGGQEDQLLEKAVGLATKY
ncbi:hypothetical protein M2284_001174 [Rhodococcus sp. LBL1]|nr:hypothetical protein [Rhodococcus sp. LBL1]MDH6682731.1 hypothetical protein [Rhodococcus sp. LBL2]